MSEGLRSNWRERRKPAAPEPPLNKADALKVAQRLFLLSGEGPRPGRASQIQKGLRALARGYAHSEEMIERMGALRSAMGAYEFPRRNRRTPPDVLVASASEAGRALWEYVFAHWPSRRVP